MLPRAILTPACGRPFLEALLSAQPLKGEFGYKRAMAAGMEDIPVEHSRRWGR